MCLYSRFTRNKKYVPNKKNGGKPPKAADPRLLLVPIGCGQCEECRQQLANNWRVRFNEELKTDKTAIMVNLTFSEEKLNWYREITSGKDEYKHDTNAATAAIRLFLERWRKKTKKSVKHWLITELGHEGTERIHLHGLIFTTNPKLIEEKWQNGWVKLGTFVNQKTINYIIKYITKIDTKHKNYVGKIHCSAGIGKTYIKKELDTETGEIKKLGEGYTFNKYQDNGRTKEYYRTKEGYKLQLPMYYRNKLFSEQERERLWLEKMDKKERYIKGTVYKVTNKEEEKTWLNALLTAQKDNEKHGNPHINWNVEKYLDTWDKIRKEKSV